MRAIPGAKRIQTLITSVLLFLIKKYQSMFSWATSGNTGYTRLDNFTSKLPSFCQSDSHVVYLLNTIVQHSFWLLLPTVLLYELYKSTLLLLLVIVVSFLCLYRAQDLLLYQPNAPSDARFNGGGLPDQHPCNLGVNKILDSYEINWVNSAHAKLDSVLLLLPPELRKNRPTMLYFHGNAGSIGHRINGGDVFHMYKNCLCNIFIFDYRGYGLSTGTPSEWGLKQDAEACLNFLRSHPEIDNDKIILFGRSLGGALALNLAAKKSHTSDVHAVIVENTFTDIRGMVEVLISKDLAKYAPNCVIKSTFPSLTDIEFVQQPILFISGQSDTLIPPRMMDHLHEKCNSHDKSIKKFTLGGHNNTWLCKGYYKALNKFISDHN